MGTINIVTINETDSAMDLFKYCDSGAEQTLSAIVDAGKDDELMDLMESIQDTWEESDIRPFLWDRESLFEDLGMDEANFACGGKGKKKFITKAMYMEPNSGEVAPLRRLVV